MKRWSAIDGAPRLVTGLAGLAGLALALGTLVPGCSTRSSAFSPPPGGTASPSPQAGGPAPQPPRPSNATILLYFDVPSEPSALGDSPRMELATTEYQVVTEPDQTVEVVLIKPDSTRVSRTLNIGPVESTIYCLPSGNQGCDHSRTVEHFSSVDLNFDSGPSEFDEPGTYWLELIDPTGRVIADPVQIVIRASPRRRRAMTEQSVSGNTVPHLLPAVGEHSLWRSSIATMPSSALSHNGVYHHPSGKRPIQVQVYELPTKDEVRRTLSEITTRFVKSDMAKASAIDGQRHWSSSDGTRHFVRWASGQFVVLIYAPGSPTTDMKQFVRAFRKRFP